MKHRQFPGVNALLLGLFLATVACAVAWSVNSPRPQGLLGQYYDNEQWAGPPFISTVDPLITSRILREKQSQLPEIFSAEWTGYLEIPQTGIYTFFTESDDGSWLHVDDILVVDNGGIHGKRGRQGQIFLRQGLHEIRVRYTQFADAMALHLWWKIPGQPSRTLIPHQALFPSTRTHTAYWLHLRSGRALQALGLLWGVAILALGTSSHLALRRQRDTLYAHSFWSFHALKKLSELVFQRLIVSPLTFAKAELQRPVVWYWLLTVVYPAIIFLTLSYARTLSDWLTDRYGDAVFSNITVWTLVIAGAGILAYFLTLRDRLFSRLLIFAVVGGTYAYILSPELREMIHAWTIRFGYTGAFLESLKIYPVTPAEKIHFIEYGLLGFLLCKTFSFHLHDKLVYPLAVASVYLIGLLDEAIQWALPNRVGEFRDIGINLLSGILAVIVVWCVLRPRIFRRHVQWSSLRPLGYTLAVAVLSTGLFLHYVHGFGKTIFLPDSGAQFVSVFSEHRLLTIDKTQRQRLNGELAEEIPPLDLRNFQYEGRVHAYYRDRYYQREMYWESYCEQEILKTYYRAYLQQRSLALTEYDPTMFDIPAPHDQHVFYTSTVHELAITAFSSRTMWAVVSISAALLALLSTFCPSAGDLRKIRNSQKPSRHWVERWILRPLFALALIFAVVRVVSPISSGKAQRPPNIVILTVDSCQPDYWGAYGYDKNTTPFFDALASEGVLFTNAIVPTSWTIPSLTSMLTGLNPNVHGIDVRAKLMDPRIPTLFEALETHGYAIGDTSYTLTEPSINSVFKKSEISPEVALSEGRSEESYLLSWMEEHKDEPFFGWVHFHTSHLPYKATPPYSQMFLDDIDSDVLEDEQIRFVHSNIIVRKGEVVFDAERHTPAIHALYAQTLRQQDAKIGKVLMKLDELGLRENTVLIITADHGEELMEHGFIGHASTSWDSTVYDDLVQVPLLIVYPPKLPQGKRIDTQVRMIDIMPTVLDLVDAPFNAPIQGKSIVPLMTRDAPFRETAYSESTPCGYSCPKKLVNNRLRSVRTNDWKFITVYDDETGETREELYNLRKDPGEQHNVLAKHPLIASIYRYEMQRWMDAPAHFPYQGTKSEEEHYLNVDVEVRPIVLFPKVGSVVSPDTHNNRVYLEWTGDPQAEYLIEYEVGKGGYHLTGELDAVGTTQWYGPFPEDIWQALPLYNPWKFRVIPKKYPDYPSDWITFEMKYE